MGERAESKKERERERRLHTTLVLSASIATPNEHGDAQRAQKALAVAFKAALWLGFGLVTGCRLGYVLFQSA